jgi:probable rRNA maturation factor
MSVELEIEDDGWRGLAGLEVIAVEAAEAALASQSIVADVFLLFTSDADMQVLNRVWRGKDTPTNVLSFPTVDMALPDGESAPLGDVVLAIETVAREAAQQGKTLGDHTSHLIVHGILHLLGYDHETDPEADAMENEERRILARLGIKDPYET